MIIALCGIVAILFDGGFQRGIPGIAEINSYRERAEAKDQREHKG